ncbi:tetratricopeptide repeat protein [Clostridium manihotivorum]|nr:tetratricopeptide repeat protein [Clostridium manihotivorum]
MGKKSNGFSKDIVIIIAIFAIMFFVNPTIGSILFWVYIVFKAIMNRDVLAAFMANSAYRKYRYESAISWYKKAALTKVSKSKIIANYVFLELKHGDVKEADKVFTTLTSERKFKDKDLQNLKMAEALIEWKKGNIDKAIEVLEQLQDSDRTSSVLETLGYFLIVRGDLDVALKFNEDALSKYEDSSIIRANLGEIYYKLGDYEKSKELLIKLINEHVNFAEPYYFSALILAEEDKKEASIELLRRASKLEESFLSNLNKDIIDNKLEELIITEGKLGEY